MRFERGASNTFTLAARPTLAPSKWLLKFVKVDGGLTMLCIAQATPEVGEPVQLTFDEQDATPDPLIGEITLPVGQWQLTVYEQSSTTNLNWTLTDRSPFTALVEVVGAYVPPPDPTDPCTGDCPTMCEQVAEADGAEVVECIADDQMNLALCAAIARPESTADIIVECIGNADKTDGVRALICVACDDATVELNGVEVATVAAGDTVDIPVLQNGSPVGSWNGTQWIIPTCPSGSTGNYWRAIALGT